MDDPILVERSPFYVKNENVIKGLRDALTYVMLIVIALLVSVQSFINLENGKFPFNTKPFASLAYRLDTFGDASLALIMGIIAGLGAFAVKRFVLAAVDDKAYHVVESSVVEVQCVNPSPEEMLKAERGENSRYLPRPIPSTR